MDNKAAEAAGVVDPGMEQPVVEPAHSVLPPPYSADAPTKYVDYHGESAYSHMQYYPKQRNETYVVTVCKYLFAKLTFRLNKNECVMSKARV